LFVFFSVDTLFAMTRITIRSGGKLGRILGALVGLLALVVSVRAEDPPSGKQPEGGRVDGASSQILNVGDRITIVYSDTPGGIPASEQQIRDDGKISLHLNLEVLAAGKKPGELEKEIRKLYIDGKFYKEISISVQTQLRYFSVGGEVRSPGSTFPHPGQMTVIKAINSAGGFTEYANRTKVIVTRYADKRQVFVNCKRAIKDPQLDVPIYPGDQIMVKRSWL
jgi:protein involved in polysaccharide export with SLBB domain